MGFTWRFFLKKNMGSSLVLFWVDCGSELASICFLFGFYVFLVWIHVYLRFIFGFMFVLVLVCFFLICGLYLV